MKWIVSMMILAFCNVLAGEQRTPASPVLSLSMGRASNRLKLTPQMEHLLTHSPYFTSRTNASTDVRLDSLRGNWVGAPDADPTMFLGAVHSICRTNDVETFQLDLSTHAKSPQTAVHLSSNQVLVLVVDGQEHKFQAEPGTTCFNQEPDKAGETVSEVQRFMVTPEFLGKLGAAKTVQMRVETETHKETRDLSKDNIKRFAYFAHTFFRARVANVAPPPLTAPTGLRTE
jgi:hypothetical protein